MPRQDSRITGDTDEPEIDGRVAESAAPVAAPKWLRVLNRWPVLVIVLATVAVLLPFVAKPLHVDDSMYVWAGEHIRRYPLDFYGFEISWTGSLLPMPRVMQNPPGASYVIALVSAVAGMREIALHLVFFIPAVLLVVGTFGLAQRFCRSPMLAALLTIVMPVFVLCATTIGSDVLMACLWVWAVLLWDRGLCEKHWGNLIVATALVSAACLTKYPAMNLLPLMIAHAVLRRGRISCLLALLIPVLALTVFEIATRRMYGRGLLSEAVVYASADRASRDASAGANAFVSMCFTGACLAPALLLVPVLWRWFGALAAAVMLAMTMMGLNLLGGGAMKSLNIDCEFGWSLKGQMAVWFVGGTAVLAATIADVARRRDAGSVLLALWIVGTMAFTGIVNWSVNGRTLLPMVPAVAIVLVRGLEDAPWLRTSWRRGLIGSALAASFILSMCVAWADQSLARSARDAAHRIMVKYGSGQSPVWFQGHWGFQYYMAQNGGKAWLVDQSQARVGDLIVVPRFNVNVELMDEPLVVNVDLLTQPATGWVSTMNMGAGAGFYSHVFGPLPFVFGAIPEEKYLVCRFKKNVGPSIRVPNTTRK